jgi:hypothetical protein
MEPERNIQRMIKDATDPDVKAVARSLARLEQIPTSSQTGSHRERKNQLRRGNQSAMQESNERSVAVRALHALSTWRNKVANCVASGIHEFWSSTILSHAERFMPSQPSFLVDTLGQARFYDARYANVVYSVQTVTGSTPLSSKTTTATLTSEKPSKQSLRITVSPSEAAETIRRLENGTLDLSTISVREWIEVSYIALFDQQDLHFEISVVEGGNAVRLHTCIRGIVPPMNKDSLGNRN